MNWTNDKPWQTGFYWYREPAVPGGVIFPATIVEVVISEESFVAKLGVDGDQRLEKYTGEWIGPIEVPK
ncbi:MAG TPA: hypothetical protein VM842_04000 [Nitrospira sp.]|nr:hypothetical protein [Nitrospira sp.]